MDKYAEMKGFERFDNISIKIGDDENYIFVENLSGWKHIASGEIYFDENTDSAKRFGEASDKLVLEKRKNYADFLKETRKYLKLTQKEASKLTGGGHNAFSRYENNKSTPLPAVINLFKLLKSNPELISILK